MVVDEIPPPSNKLRAVTMVARHVIPAFFTPRNVTGADVKWSLVRSGGGAALQGTNAGDSYLRLSGAGLRGSSGRAATIGAGLVGYVLPGSTMRFPVRSSMSGIGGKIVLQARSQMGEINTTLAHGQGK